MSKLLRGGRLGSTRDDVVRFISSIESDKRILKPVIEINKAHTIMLMEEGIIKPEDGASILKALKGLRVLELKQPVEDIHMAVEEEVTKATGSDVGGNLHIAKSRNDQVSTAIRMALRGELIELMEATLNLQSKLIRKAWENTETVIPGYTHLQPAQPLTFAHYLISVFDALGRDLNRLVEAYGRVDLCPMGAGAIATTSFEINRERVAELLGFHGLLENSVDAVGSRDFILEVLAVLSVTAVDVSRFVEDLIIWSTPGFGTIELPDGFSSTSSIMPQKKNPDVLEVIRARMSHVIGCFSASINLMKALPSSYNLDLQEATPKLWEAIDIMLESLIMLSKLIPELKVRSYPPEDLTLSFMTSTELANILTRKYGVPFREAHRIVGSLVRRLLDESRPLTDLEPGMIAEASVKFLKKPVMVRVEDIERVTDPLRFIESHKVRGGPSRVEVERMLRARMEDLSSIRSHVVEMKRRLVDAERKLNSVVERYIANPRTVKFKSE